MDFTGNHHNVDIEPTISLIATRSFPACKLLGVSGRSQSRPPNSTLSNGRFDILVDMKEVGRVIFVLDFD